MRRTHWTTIALCLVINTIGVAQVMAPAPKPEAEILAEQIKSPDPAIAQQAIDTIEQKTRENPKAVLPETIGLWAEAMLKAKRCEKLPELALTAILTRPNPGIEQFQKRRVQALLQLGRPQDALREARSLYNIAPMHSTADAIELVSQCLTAAHPEDPEIAQRFRMQQLAGATIAAGPAVGAATPSTQPAIAPSPGQTLSPADILRGQAPAEQTILNALVVDPKPYEAAHLAVQGDGWDQWRSRTLLLLLANRTAEAQQAAEQAYAIAPEAALREASELIARTLKARDGCIGRANAWVLSIRPPDAK